MTTNPNIVILDCTPAVSDVVSGAVPQPRERRDTEDTVAWLRQTPAWRRIVEEFNLEISWPGVTFRPDMIPPASLGLEQFPHVFRLSSTTGSDSLILVNADGTRCAILDQTDEIARLWANARRPKAGRRRIETTNTKTLAQRRWRENKK